MKKITPAQLSTVRQVAAAMQRGDSTLAETLIRTLPRWVLEELREVVAEAKEAAEKT